jgi:pimeloyl-ACP methyl ester carboxylesterase
MPAPGTRPTRPRTRALTRIARMAIVGYAAWCLVLVLSEPRLVYLPHLAGAPLPDARIDLDPRIERRSIAQEGGDARTEAWLLRAPAPARGLACFLHGNGELIDGTLHEAAMWNARGFDALLVEYRGYGRSGGSPSQEAIVGDVLAAIDGALTGRDDATLVLHGRSLGTGVAAQVAARIPERVAALVLESPFTSIASFAAGFAVPPFLVRNPYRTDEVLPTLDCPVLVLAARDDEVVPFAHGEALVRIARDGRHVALDGTHNSGISLDPAYWRAIDALIDGLPAPLSGR